MKNVQSVVTGIALVIAGVSIGALLSGQPAAGQSAERWHSCIAADLDAVDGNNARAMLEASGDQRVMVPRDYVPVGGGGRQASAVVILCRR
ncbi:hypothetical protein [Sandaracinus amylolyticus]|uniref:Uncharacterized protein n=1 Tax=Sandaracinus amylolyticus TaxID=927083 RepID=A0A0F6W2P2_9BACT|nr:hypothetical protein [Sandaracinus amylolyticus]AKF05733.1 hypothetical protein DB32_002882 [Sandaracinus amylolyticus]